MVSHNVFLNNYYKLSWKRNKKAREAKNLIEEAPFIFEYIEWFNKNVYRYIATDKYDKYQKSLIQKRYFQLQQIQIIINESIYYEISINSWFKQNKSKISYKTFYNLKREIIFYADRKHDRLGSFLGNNPIPKRINYKYSLIDRDKIKQYTYQCLIHNKFLDYTSIWLSIRKEDALKANDKYKDISLSTYKKILKTDERFINKEIKPYQPKHRFRTHVKELGHIQLDLKILGKYENSLGIKVPIFTMIDTSSRITFTRAIKHADLATILSLMEEGYQFFKDKGINIKSIQTDNAMMFKNTNIVKSSAFFNWCDNKKIAIRKIPLGQPECNGIIERYHLTIDKELHNLLIRAKNFCELKIVINEWNYYYNYKRYHVYMEMKDKRTIDRYYTPISSILVIREYNKHVVV